MHTRRRSGSISSYAVEGPGTSIAPSADGQGAAETDSLWPTICATQAARMQYSVNLKSLPASSPGGEGSERLPRLVGRDWALEAILSGYDYDADLAERYGWVTRAIPDAELDRFVDGVVTLLASFDKTALAAAKAQVNRATLPPDADLKAAYAEYSNSLTWPEFQARLPGFGKLVAELGVDEVELRLGDYLRDRTSAGIVIESSIACSGLVLAFLAPTINTGVTIPARSGWSMWSQSLRMS